MRAAPAPFACGERRGVPFAGSTLVALFFCAAAPLGELRAETSLLPATVASEAHASGGGESPAPEPGVAIGHRRDDAAAAGIVEPTTAAPSVARAWSEALLFAIRHDAARPPVHARNLYHLAASMYDVWALGDPEVGPVFLGGRTHPACALDVAELVDHRERPAAERRTDLERAIGQAAWRLLRHRYRLAADASLIRTHLDRLAASSDLLWVPEPGDRAALLGVRVADCVIGTGRRDGSNEDAGHRNLDYAPINPPLDPTIGGNDALVAPSRWQPLAVPDFLDQAGRRGEPKAFLGADWGTVTPFALDASDTTTILRGDVPRIVYHDPGPPPTLESDPEAYLDNFELVAIWSSHLDPADPRTIDLGPRERVDGAPPDVSGRDAFARLAPRLASAVATRAGNAARETVRSPTTVPLGDYTRVIAEYWADGIDSETPPGHWLSLYNIHVSSHPRLDRRPGGVGAVRDPLEYDLIAYLALGGALHDAAIAAWSIKAAYDYVRPVSAIRYLAEPRTVAIRGVPTTVSLPVVPGHVERVEAGDPLAGPGGVGIGQTKVRAWRGPRAIADPARDVAGVGWILARDWWPYQRPTFVTPPFAGYVSGHSAFSRAAAVVLERLTGSPSWPGGGAGFTAEANEFLVFERGPSVDVPLFWETYRDAADETALSRIWGGIHPPVDDLAGRRVGARVGESAWQRVESLLRAGKPVDVVGASVDPPPVPVSGQAPSRAGVLQGCSVAGEGAGAGMLLTALLGTLIGRCRAPRRDCPLPGRLSRAPTSGDTTVRAAAAVREPRSDRARGEPVSSRTGTRLPPPDRPARRR